jgi:hypothetical protein
MTPVVLPISNDKRWKLAIAIANKGGISPSTRTLVAHNVRMNVEGLIRWHCSTAVENKMWDENR